MSPNSSVPKCITDKAIVYSGYLFHLVSSLFVGLFISWGGGVGVLWTILAT